MVSTITDAPPAVWGKEELANLHAEYPDLAASADAVSKYNPTPGTGRTGFMNVPPNNYPFYSDAEKYVPVMQADGTSSCRCRCGCRRRRLALPAPLTLPLFLTTSYKPV